MTTTRAAAISSAPPLRDYQADMIKAVRRAIGAGRRRMYCSLPTGCGKTRVAAELVYAASQGERRTLWLVHRRELVRQAYDAIVERGVESVGIVMANERDVDSTVVVASIQSLRGSEKIEQLGKIDRVIIDECHHVSPGSLYDTVINSLPDDVVVVGITATPYRADRKSMQELLPYCAYERDIPTMINEGWLCGIRHRTIVLDDLDLTTEKMVRSLGDIDFDMKTVAPKVEEPVIVADTVANSLDYLDGRQTIVFAASVNHAHLLATAYTQSGVKAAAVDGSMPLAQRDEILRQWKTGEIQAVTNCAVLTEGFDYPSIAAVVVARPTLSVGLYLQMIGRGTRLASGKEDCIILDVTGRMPPRAVAIELADIIGEELEEEEDGTRAVRKKSKQRGMIAHALKDPYGKARFAWTAHPYCEKSWFTPVSEKLVAALVPEPITGLYMAYILEKIGWMQYKVHPASPELAPLRQSIADLEATMAKAAAVSKTLSHRNKPWRTEPATDKQLALLSTMNRQLSEQARNEHWTKGDVSLAVDAAQIERVILSIQNQLKGN